MSSRAPHNRAGAALATLVAAGISAALACGGLALLWGGLCPAASAHPSLRNYVQHRAVITVGATNIDVTLDLTFYENASAIERARMDANHDGRISRAEVEAYLAGRAFDDGLTLMLDDTPLDLVPLADPKLDLTGDTRVHPHTHGVRLSYFARTPQWLAPGGVLALTDRLWLSTAALRSIEISGTGGFRFSSIPVREAGVWRARCAAVPARNAGAVPVPEEGQR